MSHVWERQPKQSAYADWDHCPRCGTTRMYSWSPGWPGSKVFFTRTGDYSGPKGGVEPGCNDGSE